MIDVLLAVPTIAYVQMLAHKNRLGWALMGVTQAAWLAWAVSKGHWGVALLAVVFAGQAVWGWRNHEH